MPLKPSLGPPTRANAQLPIWDEVQGISIDYGIMEKAQNVLVLPVDPDWIDVGSWSAVYDVSLADENSEISRRQTSS